jgi:hypothetical protein
MVVPWLAEETDDPAGAVHV